MDSQTEPKNFVVLADDPELQGFVHGSFEEPEERVSRRGVPDYRPKLREPRPAAEIWAIAKKKVTRLAGIRMKAGRFKYTEISGDQIRLLRIRPGKVEDNIVCDLCIKSLAEVRGKYEALSYSWGVEEASEIIFIHTLQPDPSNPPFFRQGLMEEFPVRPNLFKALRQLRREDKPIVMWIDAICINQRETQAAKLEKDQQLSMMSNIYNSAKNVCIWLGDADDESTTALKLVNDIMNFQVLDLCLEATDESDERRWCDLIDTLKAPWFSRRWIIQEVASARDASVHVGKDVVHWDDLADAILLLHENLDRLKRQFKNEMFIEVPLLSATQLVKALANVCRKSQSGEIVERLLDLETLVCTFQQFQARYSEDVIHSVRSLAKDAPKPDEEKDFRTMVEHERSTRDLFIAFVNRCIKNSGSLDIICRHWAPPITDTAGEEIKLPTWISELTNGPFGLPGEARERQNGENFVALSPNDKRKRYNASLDWGAFNDSDRPRSSSILNSKIKPPKVSVLSPSGPNNDDQRLYDGGHIIMPPVASPIQEMENPYKRPLTPILNMALSESKRRGQYIQPSVDKDSTPISPHSGSSSAQISHSRDLESLENPTSPPNEDVTDENSSRNHVSPSRHRRNRAISMIGPTERPTTSDFWTSIYQTARFPGSLRLQPNRKSSKNRQETYIQQDKEHLEGLGGILKVQGFVLGVVKDHSDVMRGGIVPGDWLQKLGWNRNAQDNRVSDVLWRTLVADRNPEGGNPPGWYQRACLHCLKDTRLTNSKGDLDSHRADKVEESMTSSYLKRVESVIWRRRIIEVEARPDVTGPLLYGLAPEGTKEGDYVCILFGCSVPVVLSKVRELPQNLKMYELVGEAYVHGKMDGEAVQDPKLVKKLREEFKLQ
ncbi:hypothetical protein CC78DRAFT_614271 [Lojkania enalia]|uniref:Heterokaryon incompatibility domain-containing protein n=1 Tax=Lojkania enalia TaxID=147567 RepID=A0A9P4KEQ1_9PLEO|nr:hypothetical protein CC78DRAFT_614271 [Didymosphaeria enalia]